MILCAIAVTYLPAQSNALEAKRNRLLTELAETNQQLAATKAKRGAAVGRASLLRSQIEQRRELIETIGAEIDNNTRRMRRDSLATEALSADLKRMLAEYGHALRAANRTRINRSWLCFLLSASGINDAFRRLTYLRQYRQFRTRQGLMIRRTRRSLDHQLQRLAEQRSAHDSLLVAARDQGATLNAELASQTALVNKLTVNERKLLARVRKQRRESAALNARIREAIAASTTTSEGVEEELTSSTGIAARRGRLAWPARGEIVRPYGTQPHPDVPSVTIKNSGVDIDAGGGTPVEAIFAGKVISVRKVPGFRNVLMLKHGGYYTVYSNLERPAVKKGQEVQAGERLGFTSAGGAPLHFELWRGRKPLNPAHWLISSALQTRK